MKTLLGALIAAGGLSGCMAQVTDGGCATCSPTPNDSGSSPARDAGGPRDGGAPDAGSSGADAGTTPPDAGQPCCDAGMTGGADAGPPDAGPPPSDGGSFSMGPLKASPTNSHYFVDPSGKAVLLTGSHTWDTFQDLSQSPTPAAFDFNVYVAFLKAHGQNLSILWRKDLPSYCNWGAGGTWYIAQFPWLRPGPGTATDGLPKFDLTQFDQSYFDRERARVIQLRQNGIYAIVQLFDGLQLLNNRCSTDGYPFTGANNINGIDDSGGINSMTLSVAAITAAQDAYVQKMVDTLDDLDNVLWEISEEAPIASSGWADHMIALIHGYEAGKPFQHPVGLPWMTGGSDSTLYASAADWVAPNAQISPTNNSGKVIINDSDHSFYYTGFVDGATGNVISSAVRDYIWQNFTSGSMVLFMDPYEIYWTSGSRNLCPNPSNGVCSAPDTKYDNIRDNLGYTLRYASKMDLLASMPQPGLASTGHCLAHTGAGAEYLVWASGGGTINVDLSGATGTLTAEWLDPSAGTTTAGGTATAGGSVAFTPPFSGDAVLYLR